MEDKPIYIGPKVIGLDSKPVTQRQWSPLVVVNKDTGERVTIKDYKFDPEIHEKISEQEPQRVKTQKAGESTATTRYDNMQMKELRALAKHEGIKAPFACKKVDLVKLLNQT